MALDRYGVLAARALETRREDGSETPHLQLHLVSTGGEHWRVAINVESRQAPSELLYLVEEDFRHPVTALLDGLASGWHELAPGADGPHLDYIRGNLFDRARMRLLPPAVAGPDNDLADLLDGWLQRAVGEALSSSTLSASGAGPLGLTIAATIRTAPPSSCAGASSEWPVLSSVWNDWLWNARKIATQRACWPKWTSSAPS